ncbi:hypothetical protein RASY3_00115 [Ruminococcus albus SY3]|uniref:SipW-cognate class signal peptide n=1 Tax=Ruminococcus albus SY3 TaxID=1341156 RepID=A0A011WV48_RUMAL|nr:hypothetical protein [Ruminococcus albus]EXM40885.1 hypothetical protein RASY3_00115 [Ruminococcus albus SY3]
MKNTKKKGNPAKKLIPAAGSLMVSAVMLATSTYAWFTMNKTVTVTGMEVKTKVGSNLLISATPDDTAFAKDLSQTRQALLEPTSTVDGIQYFYTVNAGSNGDALAENYTPYSEVTSQSDAAANKTAYDGSFNTAYGATPSTTAYDTAYGYIDYAFYLKATNTNGSDTGTLVMSKCNLLYNTTGDTWAAPTDKAWRVAMFVQELGSSVSAGTAPTVDTSGQTPSYSGALKKTILRISGAGNQSGTNAVDSTTTLSAATYDTAATVDSTIASNATEYYYVVIRLWLEGEDTTCTSQTYAALTNKYKLDLQFDLNGGDGTTAATAATNITTATS